MSLIILIQNGMEKIFGALEECSKRKRTSLVRGDRKRIFGDYVIKKMRMETFVDANKIQYQLA